MPPRDEHEQPAHTTSMGGPHCPLCYEEPHAYHASHNGAILQRLEHLEHRTRDAILPTPHTRRVDEERVMTEPGTARPTPELALWQGRPAFMASAFGLLSAALWLGLWGLGLMQIEAIAASMGAWHRLVQDWLFQSEALETLWWYQRGAGWLGTPVLAENIMAVVLLAGTLGTFGLLLYRCRRALRSGYCLTTQRLSTRRGGQWTDVDLTDLDRVVVRRPFWGRVLGYGHIQFRGRFPVPRRVSWWGVPQRAVLTALLQATLQQAGTARRRSE